MTDYPKSLSCYDWLYQWFYIISNKLVSLTRTFLKSNLFKLCLTNYLTHSKSKIVSEGTFSLQQQPTFHLILGLQLYIN
jgi:hypothetical protein